MIDLRGFSFMALPFSITVIYQDTNLLLQSKIAAKCGVHFSCAVLNKALLNDESVAQFVVVTRTLVPSHLDMHTRIGG